MLRLVTGKFLTKQEKELFRKAVIYTLAYLIPDKYHKGRTLTIIVGPAKSLDRQDKDYTYTGNAWYDFDKKRAYIWLNSDLIKKNHKKPWSKFQKLYEYMCHECVHIKQMFVDGIFTEYPDDISWEEYFNLPVEIEAYGRTYYLMIRLQEMFENYV